MHYQLFRAVREQLLLHEAHVNLSHFAATHELRRLPGEGIDWLGEMAAGFLSGQRHCRLSLWSGQLAHHIVTLGLLFVANLTLRR
jgi:hypothetical protein